MNEKTDKNPNFNITTMMMKFAAHWGHPVTLYRYGTGKPLGSGNYYCYSLECEQCNEVICDTDVYDLCARRDEYEIPAE